MSPPSEGDVNETEVDRLVASVSDGSDIPRSRREVLRQHVLELCRRLGKTSVTAFELLESAEPEDSPIHDMFEWNDAVAARQHRLERARQILRSIKITIEHRGQTEHTREYEFVRVDPEGQPTQGEYTQVTAILSNEAQRDALLASARRDLRAWYLKYIRLLRLTGHSGRGLLRFVEETFVVEFRGDEAAPPRTGTDNP